MSAFLSLQDINIYLGLLPRMVQYSEPFQLLSNILRQVILDVNAKVCNAYW